MGAPARDGPGHRNQKRADLLRGHRADSRISCTRRGHAGPGHRHLLRSRRRETREGTGTAHRDRRAVLLQAGRRRCSAGASRARGCGATTLQFRDKRRRARRTRARTGRCPVGVVRSGRAAPPGGVRRGCHRHQPPGRAEEGAPVIAAWPGALIKRKDFQLFLTSFLGLYAELLCIRWMPAHVRFLSYFTNFILLASFLGLGVGILSVRRKLPLGPRTFPLILLFAAILIAATRFELKIGSAGVLYYGAGESGTAPAENALVLPAAFLLVSLLFVCIGRPLGVLLGEVTPPLRAYAFDIGGSLAGIAAFFALSWFEQPPVVWFAGLLVISLLLIGPTWVDRLAMVVPLLIAGAIAWNIGQGYWWSPYYKIGLTPTDNGDGWALNVNESGHQAMLPSDEKEPFYRAPYDLFGAGQFQKVLIIGAGSGSDTAVGLKYGQVGHIDAVEIDPVIARLGEQFHPEQPFSDPRVTVHIDDGRSFIRKSTDTYDLIIFALPDSLTLTSQFSSLRLESFLFTEQSFQEAREHLTPNGAIVLYNYYREDWLIRKLAGMLQSAFGQAPFVESFGGWGRAGVLVDGPRLNSLLAQRPDLAQPYYEIRAPTPQVNEDPDAILLPLVGQGVLEKTNIAGDLSAAPPTPATDDWPLM